MGPEAPTETVEILRLERQLAARDDVIRQLNRQLHERVVDPSDSEPDVAPEAMEEYVYKIRVLEDEIVRLRQALHSAPAAPAWSTGTPMGRSQARRIASALKRRLLR